MDLMGHGIKSSLDKSFWSLNRASILFSSVNIVSRLVLPCANEWMKPFVGLLFYLSILAVSHCCLFLESPTYLCSGAVVLYTVPPPNLVTVTLHYFLMQQAYSIIRAMKHEKQSAKRSGCEKKLETLRIAREQYISWPTESQPPATIMKSGTVTDKSPLLTYPMGHRLTLCLQKIPQRLFQSSKPVIAGSTLFASILVNVDSMVSDETEESCGVSLRGQKLPTLR